MEPYDLGMAAQVQFMQIVLATVHFRDIRNVCSEIIQRRQNGVSKLVVKIVRTRPRITNCADVDTPVRFLPLGEPNQ